MDSAVVADAGPLIAFGCIGRLALLQQVLGKILVPQTIASECVANAEKPGANAIRQAFRAKLLVRVADPPPPPMPYPMLGPGESAAIVLALKLEARLLIDEKSGRKIATNLGLTVIGSGGLLLAAKKRGIVDTIKPTLDALTESEYHFSGALVQAILKRAGEH